MNPMTIRGSHLSQPRRERICRWLTANRINPNRIPLDVLIVVTGNHVKMQVMQDQQNRRGGRTLIVTRDRGGDLVVPIRWKTYRIRYDLEDVR